MIGLMRQSGLAVPIFKDRTTSFRVQLDRHGLLDPETQRWLDAIGASHLDQQSQCVLVMVDRNTQIDDQTVRHQLAIDTRDAQRLLSRLANDGWLINPAHPSGEYAAGERLRARHLFQDETSIEPPRRSQSDRAILAAFDGDEALSIHELAARASVSVHYARARLRVLISQRDIVPTASATSRLRRYRLP